MRGATKAAVKTKKAPSKPPAQCHQCKLFSVVRLTGSRCHRANSNKAAVPTRKETVAAFKTLLTSFASKPLIPACSGIRAPEINAMASNDQYTCGDITHSNTSIKRRYLATKTRC